MPQNEHIELHRKRHGRRLDHEERTRKRELQTGEINLLAEDEIVINHFRCHFILPYPTFKFICKNLEDVTTAMSAKNKLP